MMGQSRKIFTTNGRTLAISIPSYLVDKYELKAGDFVHITDSHGKIIIGALKSQ